MEGYVSLGVELSTVSTSRFMFVLFDMHHSSALLPRWFYEHMLWHGHESKLKSVHFRSITQGLVIMLHKLSALGMDSLLHQYASTWLREQDEV